MKDWINYLATGFTLALFVIFVAATAYWGWIELRDTVRDWQRKRGRV